ncbi:PhaM family polyhydroxyalkanoate granule multifunctional regulatory protein [Castellaniella denitrificans]|uniref:Transcriptional regulator n=1 Tax=Castellaniella denitrificans TaxID=56119 RepID=A0ABT4M0N1_9BURK|nr:PhaM family polyhydroxyalkanoate granule multifunctional regulatory protein [Castellaniella denitrificans]MCZ4328867.1 transcriptional regulator [Castellaniella denitrificans]
MAQDSTTNPFVLPGFGQQGDAARNPLFAGLDMMRQAWQNMAGAGGLDAAQLTPMSLEDLDRRIRELQTVQNWLQLNATMLANTIQGMEIQRSTLSTLKSFAGGAFPGAAPEAASPAGAADAAGSDYARAAGDWWNLVQQQFEQLATATAAGLQGMAESAEQAAAPAKARTSPARKKPASARKSTTGKAPAKKASGRSRA